MLCAHPAAGAEPTAAPVAAAPAVAPGSLDSTLADLAGALRAIASQRGSYLVAGAEPASLLDSYAAQTLAASLDRAATPARRLNGSASPSSDDPFGDALPPCLLPSLARSEGHRLRAHRRLASGPAAGALGGRL